MSTQTKTAETKTAEAGTVDVDTVAPTVEADVTRNDARQAGVIQNEAGVAQDDANAEHADPDVSPDTEPRRSRATDIDKPELSADHFVVRSKAEPESKPSQSTDVAAEATESPKAAGSLKTSESPQVGKSPGKNGGGFARLRKHWKLPVACAASLFLGFAGTLCLPKGEEPQVVVEKPVQRSRYVAVAERRHEPIAPLAPFDGLEPQVVELGKKLFHDPGLSGNGRVACVNCHNPASGGSIDGSGGNQPSRARRDPPSVLNSAINAAQFWDGSIRNLNEQLDSAINDPEKMDSDWERVITYVENNANYVSMFEQHLGGPPTNERVQQAIVTYERSLVTLDSPFDQWLTGSDEILNSDQYGGYYTFTKLGCINCHHGAGVGGGMFEKLGAVVDYYSDVRPADLADLGRYEVTQREADRHVFRVPSLRNVEYTAPYFHDGSVETLDEAVRRMIVHQLGEQPNAEEVRRIVEFLKTLSGKLPRPNVE